MESAGSFHGDGEEGDPLLLASLKENVLPLELVCWAGFSVALDNLEILYLINIFLTWVWSKDVGVVEDGADLVGLVQTLLLRSSDILVIKTNQKHLDLDKPGFGAKMLVLLKTAPIWLALSE